MPHGVDFQTEEEFFQPLLPMPEITKVTLEYVSPAPTRTFVNNPHIDVGTGTAFTDVERQSGRDPASQNASSRNKTLKVTYDLVIKERDVGSSFSVLSSDMIINALKIKVFIVTNQSGKYTKIADGRTLSPVAGAGTGIESRSFDFSSFQTGFSDANKTKIIETEENGKRVFVYPKRDSIELSAAEASNLDSLGIVVYSYVDPGALLTGDLNPALQQFVDPKSLQSRRDSLLILEGGQISSTKFVFTDLKRKVWNGPVHEVQSLEELQLHAWSDAELNNNVFLNTIQLEVVEKAIKQPPNLINAAWLSAEIRAHPRWGRRSAPIAFLNFDFDSAPVQRKLQILRVVHQRNIDHWNDLLSVNMANRTWEWIAGSGTSTLQIIRSGVWKPLNKTVISDPKVQDFRTRDAIQEIQYDYTTTINDIFSELQKDLRGDRIDISKINTYFSDMYLSRDYWDNCRYFFTMDWKRILIDNSFFGKLFEFASDDEQRNLLQESRINEIRIIRKRLEGSSEIGSKPIKLSKPDTFSPITKPKPFDEDEIPEIIVSTKESTINHKIISYQKRHWIAGVNFTRIPMDSNVQRNILARVNGTFLSEVDAQIQYSDAPTASKVSRVPSQLRHFTGIDGRISTITDGYYHYGIEMDIIDGSAEIIREKLRALLSHIEELKIYYMDAIGSPPRAYGNIPPQYSSYVDTGNETASVPGEIRLGMNFNAATNRFSPQFIEKYTDQALVRLKDSLQRTIAFPSRPSPGYIEILDFFSGGSLTPQEIVGIKSSLLDYLNPNSATPDSIGVVIKLMETLAEKIESILNITPPPEISSTVEFAQKPADKVIKDRSIKIQHEFSSIFNANLPNKLGFDYLQIAKSDIPGLCAISKSEFEGLVAQEMEKIFVDDINYDLNYAPFGRGNAKSTSGTYFTPFHVYLPDRETHIDLTDTARSEDYLESLSWSLYGKRIDEDVLVRLGRGDYGASLIAPGPGARLVPSSVNVADYARTTKQSVLANSLASYFFDYHSAIVVDESMTSLSWWAFVDNIRTPGTPGAVTRLRSGELWGDTYNKTMQAAARVERDKAYFFLLGLLQQTDFEQNNKRKIPMIKSVLSVEDYDLSSFASTQAGLMVDKLYKRAMAMSRTAGGSFTVARGDILRMLESAPPQIKSLFAFTNSNNPSTYNQRTADLFNQAASNSTEMKKNPSAYPEFVFKTQMINQVDVLVGYEKSRLWVDDQGRSRGGELLLGKPIWKKMQSYDGSASPPMLITSLNSNQNILCRQTSYTNMLVEGTENFNLPTYGEFFLCKG